MLIINYFNSNVLFLLSSEYHTGLPIYPANINISAFGYILNNY